MEMLAVVAYAVFIAAIVRNLTRRRGPVTEPAYLRRGLTLMCCAAASAGFVVLPAAVDGQWDSAASWTAVVAALLIAMRHQRQRLALSLRQQRWRDTTRRGMAPPGIDA